MNSDSPASDPTVFHKRYLKRIRDLGEVRSWLESGSRNGQLGCRVEMSGKGLKIWGGGRAGFGAQMLWNGVFRDEVYLETWAGLERCRRAWRPRGRATLGGI